MITILIILLILILVGALPGWGYHAYGWGPSGIVGIIVIILLVLLLTGHVHI
jgi:hypothetical protein